MHDWSNLYFRWYRPDLLDIVESIPQQIQVWQLHSPYHNDQVHEGGSVLWKKTIISR